MWYNRSLVQKVRHYQLILKPIDEVRSILYNLVLV